MARKKQPKKKVEVVFDIQKRKEFLTGFRKRKNERRSKAKAELDRNLKEEHKRIRAEVKDSVKHLKKSFEPLKELTEEDKVEKADAYEDEEVQVKIVELSTNQLAAQSHMLGANLAEESEPEEQSASEAEDDTNRIPGMDFDVNKRKTAKAKEEAEEANDPAEMKSKKELNRLMKTKTLKKIKKSKLFKMKERMDKTNNLKKTKQNRNNTIKSVPKHLRKKLKHGQGQGEQRYNKGRLLNKKALKRQRGD